MESAEGKGIARKAWDTYASAVNRAAKPALDPIIESAAASGAADLLGFWLVWQLEGGFEGMRRNGMSRSTIFRRIKRFRQATGQHPDEFTLPGVSLDVEAYMQAGNRSSSG